MEVEVLENHGTSQVDLTNDKAKEDQDTIESLKKEIEKAWKMVDTAQVTILKCFRRQTGFKSLPIGRRGESQRDN